MDSYQPIYDAVRSRISNGDIGSAVEAVFREMNLGHYASQAGYAAIEAANEHARPSVVFRPTLQQDGDQWCALLGENLQVGVAAFGKSPAEAMWEFDKAWHAKLPDGDKQP